MMNLLSKDGITTRGFPRLSAERLPMPLIGTLAGTMALSVYLLTIAPDLTWQHSSYDGGELITAAVTLGIPHPPGYPTYILLGKVISLIPLGTVAFRFNLLSAVSVAIATALLTITIGRLYFSQGSEISVKNSVFALAAGLAFAYTPLVWSQAIVTEVYGLNLAFLAGFLWALIARRAFPLASLLLGLSITAHLTSLFLLPLGLGLIPRAQWRSSAVWLLIGLTPLATIPLLAQANSPVIWGQPTNLQGWWWLVSGQLYHNNLRFPPEAQHVMQVLKALLQQFLWLTTPFVVTTLVVGGLRPLLPFHPQRLNGVDNFQLLPQPFLLTSIGLYIIYALLYHTTDAAISLLPALLLLALLIAPTLRLFGAWALVLPLALLLLNYQSLDASRDSQVRPVAENILSAAPDNAILLTPGDRSIFSLWYFHHVENQRPDVVLVDSNLFAFSWYRQQLQKQHPGLRGLAIDNLATFRQENYQLRPICRANLVKIHNESPGIWCNET